MSPEAGLWEVIYQPLRRHGQCLQGNVLDNRRLRAVVGPRWMHLLSLDVGCFSDRGVGLRSQRLLKDAGDRILVVELLTRLV